MGAVATALLVGFGALSMSGSNSPKAYLYTDLDPTAAQGIAEKLKAQAIPFELSADGTAILAPQDRIAELRMSMAADRLGGKIGYDVLDAEQPFGISAERAKINETRAIEGELVRSIESLDHVSRARVHIVMPEREMFATEARRATAAITVKTQGRLSGENVQAIRYLVASSVPELAPDAISVIDQTGALLARSGDPGAMAGGDVDQRQQAIETRFREQIESLLEPIVGAGKVRAEVTAVIDRDQTREEASIVDPDKQAIAKQVSVESTDQANEASAAGQAASVSTQLPENKGAPVASSPAGDSRRSNRNETSEDTTYENSRTSTVTVRGPGRVKRLTVAVMIDPGTAGLPPPQVARLQRLVENAVGFDSERGDSVAIEAMKFTAADLANQDEPGFLSKLPTEQLWSVLKLLILAGVALLALKLLKPRGLAQLAGASGDPMLLGVPGTTLLSAASPENAAASLPAPIGDPGTLSHALAHNAQRGAMLNQEIALAEVDGRIKASAVKRIGETVQSSPGEATAVIRQWLGN